MHAPAICTIVAKNYLAHARCLAESFLEQHRTPQSGCFDALLVKPGAGEYVPSHQKIIAFGKPQFQSRLNVKDGACQQSAIWPYDMKERRPVDAFRLR